MPHPASAQRYRHSYTDTGDHISRRNGHFESIDQSLENHYQDALLERLLKDVAALEVARKTSFVPPGPDRNETLQNDRDMMDQQDKSEDNSDLATHAPGSLKTDRTGRFPSDDADANDPEVYAEDAKSLQNTGMPKGWWLLPAVILGTVVWLILVFFTVLWIV